jgi:hypothetical protein
MVASGKGVSVFLGPRPGGSREEAAKLLRSPSLQCELRQIQADEPQHAREIPEVALLPARMVLDPEPPFRSGHWDFARLAAGADDEHVEIRPQGGHRPPSISSHGIGI